MGGNPGPSPSLSFTFQGYLLISQPVVPGWDPWIWRLHIEIKWKYPFWQKVYLGLSGWGQSYEIVGRWRTNRINRRMWPTIDLNLGLSLRGFLFFIFIFCWPVYFVRGIRSNTNNITSQWVDTHGVPYRAISIRSTYSTTGCTQSIVQVSHFARDRANSCICPKP